MLICVIELFSSYSILLFRFITGGCGVNGAVCTNSTDHDDTQAAKSAVVDISSKRADVYSFVLKTFLSLVVNFCVCIKVNEFFAHVLPEFSTPTSLCALC